MLISLKRLALEPRMKSSTLITHFSKIFPDWTIILQSDPDLGQGQQLLQTCASWNTCQKARYNLRCTTLTTYSVIYPELGQHDHVIQMRLTQYQGCTSQVFQSRRQSINICNNSSPCCHEIIIAFMICCLIQTKLHLTAFMTDHIRHNQIWTSIWCLYSQLYSEIHVIIEFLFKKFFEVSNISFYLRL